MLGSKPCKSPPWFPSCCWREGWDEGKGGGSVMCVVTQGRLCGAPCCLETRGVSLLVWSGAPGALEPELLVLEFLGEGSGFECIVFFGYIFGY